MLTTDRRARRGTVTVWVVACLSVLVGVAAVGMDGGRMMDERRSAQAAADAAALAAGADMYENYAANTGADPDGTARAAALLAAAANGYANDGTNSVVTVNIPPASGPFAGKAEYAEVVIESNIDAGFSRIFSAGKLAVRARAVARGRPRAIGIIALSPSGAGAIRTSGSGSLRVLDASIAVNSTDPLAYTNTSGDLVSADSFEIAGGYQNNGAGLVGPVHTGVPPTDDPLHTIPPPDPAAYTVRSASKLTVGGNGATLQPGVYRGGIAIRGGGTVTLAPGVYIIDGGGLSIGGNSTLTGTGVTIYNTGGAAAGPIDTTGNTTITLTPPTSGPYAGISIFQDRTLTTPVTISGNTKLQIGGTVYAPAAAINVSGSSTVTPYAPGGGIIAAQVSVSGNGTMTVDPGSNRPRSPDVRLVD
jgi:Flp pilus assembly protein TadG